MRRRRRGVADPSLVGKWTLGQPNAVSTTIFDVSGNKNNGTSANTPVFTYNQNGVLDKAMVFNGSTDLVDCGGFNSVDYLTISCWIKYDSGANGYPLSKFGANLQFLLISLNNQFRFYCGSAASSDNAALTGTSYSPNTWYYVVGVYDGTNTKIYVDGVFIANAATPIQPVLESTNVFIGSKHDSSAEFEGNLSDVAIYSEAKSASWVLQQYLNNDVRQNLVTDGTFDDVTLATAKGLAGITKATPGVVTFDAAHGYADGDIIYFSGLTEMTELNGEYWQLQNNAGDTFELAVAYGGASLDTSGYGAAETTGGNVAQATSFTNWTQGAGWYVGVDGAGALTNTANAIASTAELSQNSGLIVGNIYTTTYTISNYSAGGVRIELGNDSAAGTTRGADDTFTESITSTTANTAFDGITAFTGSIDSVSVVNITP